MFRILVLTIVSVSCFGLFVGLSQFASSQTQDPKKPNSNANSNTRAVPTFDNLWNAYPKEGAKMVITDDSDQYSMKWLRRDYRIANVVAYVDVVKKKLLDHTKGADCDNDRGTGYCSYLLTAEVKEVFKGDIKLGRFEFVESSDADYPKKGFIGKKVVFLEWGDVDTNERRHMGTMENSTRSIDQDVLKKMRRVTDPLSSIDENDEREPYSIVAIQKSFAEALEVAYVDVTSFRPDRDDPLDRGSIMTASVKEVFKGRDLIVGQEITFRENLIHRRHRKEDLGKQVVYLSIPNDNRFKRMKVDKVTGKQYFEDDVIEKGVIYENEKYTEAFIKYNILEKLRKISSEAVKSK